ncbi:MAG TPA: hypothetical protein VN745_09395 [Verrucomicrobiae bacterium]|nr:hypothetical protein [Verrucomicrobiae bacterium]
MRIRNYMLALALCAPVTSGVVFAQAQQAQNGSSAAQTADSRHASASTSATEGSKAKPASKSIVFTNENLSDAATNNETQVQSGSQSAAQNHAKNMGTRAASQSTAKKQQAAAAPTKPKIELDPHKVLTNDDLRKLDRQGGMSVVGNDSFLNGIYDCDINCYNQVRSSAQVYPSGSFDWMRDLRTGIEKLKLDNDWRAYLVHLADLRSKICTIADEERTALERADNENNVTDQQIDIREEYTRKLKDVNDDITAEYGRMSSMQSRYSPLVSRFMYTQVLRIMTSQCPGSQYGYYSNDPENMNR